MSRPNLPLLVAALALTAAPRALAQDGAAIFKQNCSACHKMGGRMVGPDLTGITEKMPEEWLRKFIHSSQGMVKSGDKDAVAIWEEYNKTVMPDQPLSDADLGAVLGYLGSFGKQAPAVGKAAAPVQEEAPMVFTEADVEQGRRLFQGHLSGGGPGCVSCHNATARGVIPGGLLAKDLTHVYGRMGQAGIAGILGAPPFPAMAAAYNGGAALTDQEIKALTAFFKDTDAHTVGEHAGGKDTMLMWGGAGLVAILLLVAATWAKRLRRPVRHEIDKRQLRTI